MAAFIGLFAAQNDSASTNPNGFPAEAETGYVYMDFNSDADGEGLLPFFRDPATRSAVIVYLENVVGDDAIAGALVEASDRYSLDPALVVSLSWQESRFRPRAQGHNTNGSVDRGLMQLNSSTFVDYHPDELFDIELNTQLGAAYLRESLDRAGNTVAALAMYNAGPHRVGMIGAPRSTLDYISNIMAYREELIRDFRDGVVSGGILMTRDIKPVKNPDLL